MEPDDDFESEELDDEEEVRACGDCVPRVCPETVVTEVKGDRKCRDVQQRKGKE